jgi:XTP/dITP diphosphohydrolase
MSRRFEGEKLVVASHNLGKVKEITELLAPFGVEAISAGDLGLSEPEETGQTFEANAQLKALAAAKEADLPALADDSGLCVDALGGDPGIYSARWGGSSKNFDLAMEKVQSALMKAGAHQPGARGAHFACALCLAWPDGHTETFLGTVEGEILWPPRGNRGFGYDPVFKPKGLEKTFAEIDPAEKHAMSHRARAFEELIKACFDKAE